MRTLDDIVPPSRRKETPLSADGAPTVRESGRRSQFPYLTFIVVILIIVASVSALFYFSSARVEVTPNSVSAAVQSSFTASKSSGNLPFEIITAQKVASQSVAGSGTKAMKSSASGDITIYNTQSKAQKLIANTRFATSAGLIFRIHSAVTVPGGSSAKPGSVTAKVFADQKNMLEFEGLRDSAQDLLRDEDRTELRKHAFIGLGEFLEQFLANDFV